MVDNLVVNETMQVDSSSPGVVTGALTMGDKCD